MSACSVAKCCSASVSVGAISAACMPCSTARSMACSATTVLPEPTSPMSRRCIGRSAARSASISSIAVAWSPVGVKGSSVSRHTRRERRLLGQRHRRLRGARARHAGAAARPGRRAARRRPAARGRPRGRRSARRRPRRGGRAGARRPAGAAGSGSTTSATRVAVLAHEARICVEVMPLVAGYCEAASATPATASVRAWLLTRKRLRALVLAGEHEPRPGLVLALSHGWLKKVAFMTPVASATTASTSGFMPRRRTGAS